MPRSSRLPRRTVAASVTVLLAMAGLAIGVPAAHADGPTTFTNSAAIAIPATGSADQIGPANPYPSSVAVSGMAGTVSAVQVVFHGLTHAALNDVDAMIVAPTGQNLVILSDTGDPGTLAFSADATLTFDDAAASGVPSGGAVPTGTYRPSNTGTGDTFAAPAPAPSAATTLSGAFGGIDPNGIWQLFIVDDATGDTGQIAGGWSLVITTESAAVATTTVLTTSASPSTTGSPVTFTVTVLAAGNPVTAGTVALTADGVPLGTVPVNASGTATLTTSLLSEGTHLITATYSGTTGFLTSSGSLTQRVDALLVADAGGPYTVAEGGTLTLDGGPDRPAALYEWDLNDDGVTDATGRMPTLSWDQLQNLGIDDGPAAHTVSLRAIEGTQTSIDLASLTVTNTAPETVVSGELTGTAGVPFTIKVGADDPSSADMAALFDYTVDWGDGSPVTAVSGPADPPVTHTYATAGTYTASLSSTDKDGGIGEPLTIEVIVEAAPPEPPAPPAPPAGPAALPATGADATAPTLAAGMLLLLGMVLLIAGRRSRIVGQR